MLVAVPAGTATPELTVVPVSLIVPPASAMFCEAIDNTSSAETVEPAAPIVCLNTSLLVPVPD